MATNIAHLRGVEPALVELRQAPRMPVRITRATVRQGRDAPIDAVLHDISMYGCRFMSRAKYLDADKLWLRFQGNDPVSATVVWSNANFVGCRFDKPIDKAVLRTLTRAID